MAWFRSVDEPHPDVRQQNLYNTDGLYGGLDAGPRRSAPREPPFARQRLGRWWEMNRELRNHKPAMYTIRPVDGKRRGARGRLADALTNEGPDVFVIKCGDKRALMRDRPQRWQWSGRSLTLEEVEELQEYDMDLRDEELAPVRDWRANTARKRHHKGLYNFLSRRYESQDRMKRIPARNRYTDVRWADGAKRSDRDPLSFRDGRRQWWSRVPHRAGNWPGGRPGWR